MKRFFGVLSLLLFALPSFVSAETAVPAAASNPGDIAWILVSSALVLLMTPGLAFFYGGIVRRKNILGMFMQCLWLCVFSLSVDLFGYCLLSLPATALSADFISGS